MLLNLSHGKQDFFKEVVESFANKSGSFTLFDSLFESGASRERSFIGTDDIGNVSTQPPVQVELHKYDIGKRCYFLKLSTALCTRTSSANTCKYLCTLPVCKYLHCNRRQIPGIAVQSCLNVIDLYFFTM